jgi:hypothetical protein
VTVVSRSSALAPGEKPVFMSSILSRPRHRLTAVLPSKRRILVLTDTPRLLCIKEQRDRVVIKSELSFSSGGTGPPSVKGTTPTTPVSTNGRGRTLARWKQPSTSSAAGASSLGAASSSGLAAATEGEVDGNSVIGQTIQSVDIKGEKSFVVETVR